MVERAGEKCELEIHWYGFIVAYWKWIHKKNPIHFIVKPLLNHIEQCKLKILDDINFYCIVFYFALWPKFISAITSITTSYNILARCQLRYRFCPWCVFPSIPPAHEQRTEFMPFMHFMQIYAPLMHLYAYSTFLYEYIYYIHKDI